MRFKRDQCIKIVIDYYEYYGKVLKHNELIPKYYIERLFRNKTELLQIAKIPYYTKEQIQELVDRVSDKSSGCWELPFYDHKEGLPVIMFHGKTTPVRDIIIPNNYNKPVVFSTCNNKKCCNPKHLKRKNNTHLKMTDEDLHGILDEYSRIKDNADFVKSDYINELTSEFGYTRTYTAALLRGIHRKNVYDEYKHLLYSTKIE